MILATYPEVDRSGPLLLPYLVLLRVGFSLPAGLLRPRCALTAPFHPYLNKSRRYIFCGTFRRTLRPARPLAGTLPYGDRTFLSRITGSDRPNVQPHRIIVALPSSFCTVTHGPH